MTHDEYQRERMATWRAVVAGVLAGEDHDYRVDSDNVVAIANEFLDAFDAKFGGCVEAPSAEPASEWRPCSKEEALDKDGDSEWSFARAEDFDGWHTTALKVSTDFFYHDSRYSFRTKAKP